MGERAIELGVNILTGFPAASLLKDGRRVAGVRTAPSGLDREGRPGPAYAPPTDLAARVTVLAEGTRGSLTQAYLQEQEIGSPNPQIYALGVKELWETKHVPAAVVHTLGWPLPRDAFGGGWLYPMGKDLVSFGVVAGLDYPDASLDVHELLQSYKAHPLLKRYLDGGRLVEWGAKTIPEGGYYSLPGRLSGDGLLIIGDGAGLVNVASLKGIHYAVQSGIFAARAIFQALKGGKDDASSLAPFDEMVHASFIGRDLYETRNMRLAFKEGFWRGGLKAATMSMTRGVFPGRMIMVKSDADIPRQIAPRHLISSPTGLSKVDAVYQSGNVTRDDIPQHLIAGNQLPPEIATFYAHVCPAGVYELRDGGLVVNPPNCIDCKATDILGPRWTAREGGSGPRYRRM